MSAPRWTLRRKDLNDALDERQYPSTLHASLLRVMERLELCLRYPAPDDDSYLIPQFLRPAEPESASAFEWADCLHFRYSYSVWLDKLVARFIVRAHAMSSDDARWRYGVVLSFRNNRALVRADPQSRTVTISIDGQPNERQQFLATIRSYFNEIHWRVPDLRVEEVVPVSLDPGVAIAYDVLVRYREEGRRHIRSPATFEMLDVRALLGDPVPDAAPGKTPARVFVAYAHQDKEYFERLSVMLMPLVHTGLLDLSADLDIRVGENWQERISERLERADLILLLVSPAFLASEYVSGVEMKRVFERHRSAEADVLAVIVIPCFWQDSPLRELQVLPPDAVPISRRTDHDRAWLEVVEGVKTVAEARRSRNR